MSARAAILLLAVACWAGCDRNLEPFVPGEEPRAPDLSSIFPEGAERRGEFGGMDAPQEPSPTGGRGLDATADAEPIRGVVSLPPERAGAGAGGVLFLIARAGPGPPLAVQRIPGPSFPLAFELGPGDRMIPSIPFAGELELTARLDMDGDASSRTPGDLEGRAPGRHAPGARDVHILLDQVL